jgi:hypothetical protein
VGAPVAGWLDGNWGAGAIDGAACRRALLSISIGRTAICTVGVTDDLASRGIKWVGLLHQQIHLRARRRPPEVQARLLAPVGQGAPHLGDDGRLEDGAGQ